MRKVPIEPVAAMTRPPRWIVLGSLSASVLMGIAVAITAIPGSAGSSEVEFEFAQQLPPAPTPLNLPPAPRIIGDSAPVREGGDQSGAPRELDALEGLVDSYHPPEPLSPPGGVYDALVPYLPDPGEWASVPGTEPSTVVLSRSVIRAWNSLAWDEEGGQLYTKGAGGHSDYGGNEGYSFDFSTLTWTRLDDPDPLTGPFIHDSDGDGTNDACPAPSEWPTAVHQYDGIEWLGDRIFLSGWISYCSNYALSDNRAWEWNLDTNVVTDIPAFGTWSSGATDIDPATGNLLIFRRNQVIEVDPDTWTVLRQSPVAGQYGIDSSGVFDPVERKFYVSVNEYLLSIDVPLSGSLGSVTKVDAYGWWKGAGLALVDGKIVSWLGTDTIVTYDLSTGVRKEIIGTGAAVPSIVSPAWGIYGRFGYIPELDVFWGFADYDEPLWLFRLPESEQAASNFQERCASPGVVFCDPLDTEGPYDGAGNVLANDDGTEGIPNYGWWKNWRGTENGSDAVPGTVWPYPDSQILASGTGSMHMEYPTLSGPGEGGMFTTNFSKDLQARFGPGDTFYVQFRVRYACDFIYLDCDPQSPDYKTERRTYNHKDGGGTLVSPKIMIIAAGDETLSEPASSCNNLHIVLTSSPASWSLRGYHSCGWYEGFSEPLGGGNYNSQPNGAYDCQWQSSPRFSGPNCFVMEPDEWITIQVRLQVGNWQPTRTGTPESNVTVWAAHEGEPQQVVIDHDLYLRGPDGEPHDEYGKIWLLPFMTGKDPAQDHPTGHIWYDELIVSTEQIANPR